MNEHLAAIVGPTATGKTALAVHLAVKYDGEIVSADSRQIYRYMDIGTAKPSASQLTAVRHHLIDIINPDEDFSLADFQRLASEAIQDIRRRGKLPILAGGSGLYVRALLEGWGIPKVAPDPEYRARLEKRAAQGEAEELYRELERIDPEAAREIDRRNVRRVIRALEVTTAASIPFSRMKAKDRSAYDALTIGLTAERQELYRRIDERVDGMIEAGLVEEVRGLFEKGYGMDLPAMSGIGYRQIGLYLRGEISLESAVYQIKTETHRLVRKQYNWFKLSDKSINWFDITSDYEEEVTKLVEDRLSA